MLIFSLLAVSLLAQVAVLAAPIPLDGVSLKVRELPLNDGSLFSRAEEWTRDAGGSSAQEAKHVTDDTQTWVRAQQRNLEDRQQAITAARDSSAQEAKHVTDDTVDRTRNWVKVQRQITNNRQLAIIGMTPLPIAEMHEKTETPRPSTAKTAITSAGLFEKKPPTIPGFVVGGVTYTIKQRKKP